MPVCILFKAGMQRRICVPCSMLYVTVPHVLRPLLCIKLPCSMSYVKVLCSMSYVTVHMHMLAIGWRPHALGA